ncbi:MAG TPA: hypothetical protein VKY19_25215 [Ktedonosporobacter sp.]|nr:hypothetical protein [Ktedonosporobacter sp.]
MITCNHCGNAVPDGVKNCQKCGWPLKADGGSGPRAKAQEQSALPPWLESLRAGERPSVPTNNASKFSTADLIDEGALPGWMRSERSGTSDATGPNAQLPSSAHPAQEGGAMQGSSLLAQSLIDERSLPSWMREGKPTEESATRPAAQGNKNIPASSLVQPEAMPEWMKSLQPQSPPSRSAPTAPAVSPSQPPARPAEPTPPPARGFSPRELIDESALPSWMAPQNGTQGAASPTNVKVTGPEQQGQSGGLSGSSLLDVSALPPWLREGERGGPSGSAGSSPTQSSTWQPPAQTPPPGAQGVPGSSFLDMNALPEWLRSAAEPGGAANYNSQGPGAYAGPPRVENIRVPSRPRHEMSPSESSEVAANVFASMLGVAPATPQFPGGPANPAYMSQGMPPMGAMSGATPEPVPGTPPRPAGMPPQGYNPASMGYGGYPGGNQGGYPAAGGPQYPAGMQGMPPGAPASPQPYMPSTPAVAGEQRVNKPKRGLVEALRDLLFR